MAENLEHYSILNLRPGEIVEVRSEAEIMATLDKDGNFDKLPFMPEMLEFCGKQFKVYKRSDKTCDTINLTGSRRMWHTVHLEDVRCDGAAHGGCQARCLTLWKEAWLKRVQPSVLQGMGAKIRKSLGRDRLATTSGATALSRAQLQRTTLSPDQDVVAGEETYSCQVTELLNASVPLPWWDIRQYFRDVWTGNIGLWEMTKGLCIRGFNNVLKFGVGYRALIWGYNQTQHLCGGTPYPYRTGTLAKTPSEELNLQPGELVEVKSHDEILATLDKKNKNRGLFFDVEMAPFCNGQFRVLQKVERIINEKTGKMSTLPGGCVMLEGVICKAIYSDRRIACPRSIYSYWREIWLKRTN
jgi:hypothetical protein